MMCRASISTLGFLTLAVAPALAQSTAPSPVNMTVSSLLAQGYAIAGTVSAPSGGAGLFMRKDTSLYFCFLSETPKSQTVSTEYCKPVE